uniref:Ig-like domain-containing protein n=1 Tax=Astatotilapia calliptera TaxID=8154 RepID=A0A3P8QB62_ASTCA
TVFCLLLILQIYGVVLSRHSLKYFITASSGNPNISEFMGIGMVDGVEAGYCDLRNRILEIKQDWAKKIVDKDPRQLHVCFVSLSSGVHFLQRIDGCEWDETTGKVTGLTRFGYDGEDFIELDLKTLTWIALKPEAVNTKIRWDAERAQLRNDQYFLNVVCPTWLKTVWNTARSSLQRKVLPSVSLLQKTPSSPISCHATGFYPGRAVIFWRKDGEEIHEDVYLGEILPNNDETFQMSADLSILSVTPEDWGRYDCVFHFRAQKHRTVPCVSNTACSPVWVLKGRSTFIMFLSVKPEPDPLLSAGSAGQRFLAVSCNTLLKVVLFSNKMNL